jgi:hypothetical protein
LVFFSQTFENWIRNKTEINFSFLTGHKSKFIRIILVTNKIVINKETNFVSFLVLESFGFFSYKHFPFQEKNENWI